MALACVLDASAAVRLTLGDAAASGLAESIRSATLVSADRRLNALAERVLP